MARLAHRGERDCQRHYGGFGTHSIPPDARVVSRAKAPGAGEAMWEPHALNLTLRHGSRSRHSGQMPSPFASRGRGAINSEGARWRARKAPTITSVDPECEGTSGWSVPWLAAEPFRLLG